MPRPAVPLDPERLLQEDPFVRGLARQLLRDDDRADELAQTTWLELLRKPLSAETPRTLLATIVRRLAHKQRRSEQRTQRREREQQSPDPVPSPREILEREETRARVVRAVLALPVEMRDVVVLRFFENLPPRAISKRLSIPVETVRTRHKRALARLREELDATTEGGRSAWTAALAPFAVPAAAGVGAMTFVGGLLMAAKGKAVALAAMCVLTLGCWFALRDGDAVATAGEPSRDRVAQQVAADAETASTPVASAQDEAAPVRTEARAARSTGDLIVRVVRTEGANTVAAKGVLVEVARKDDPDDGVLALTDDVGRAVFSDLQPATYAFEVPARKVEPQWVTAEVVAGETAERTFALVGGIELRGLVVGENGQPLHDAEVVVSDWGGERSWVVARTGRDGRFLLAAANPLLHVGARHTGYEPSFVQTVAAAAGAAVEVRIELALGGAAMHGVVRDAEGRPVANARVAVGWRQQDFTMQKNGSLQMSPRGNATRTDAEGRYALHSLRTVEQPVVVRAEGRSPTIAIVSLAAGEDREQDFVLLPEAVLSGTVRDERGQPCPDARVSFGKPADPIQLEARVDSSGAFTLHGLPLMETTASAFATDGRSVEQTFAPRAGERLHWDAVFAISQTITGHLLDAADRPVENVFLEAMSDDFQWMQSTRTDANGAFVLKGFPDAARIALRARRFSLFPEAVFDGLVARAEEYVLRMPERREVILTGRILLPDGSVPQNLQLMPVFGIGNHGSPLERVDPETGAFRIGPYPPGDFQLLVECPDYARVVLPPRRVDADFDYGTIALTVGGTAKLNLQWAGAGPLPGHTVVVTTREGTAVQTHTGSASTMQIAQLSAGEYVLQLQGEGIVALRLPLTIQDRAETVLDVPVHAGVRVELVLTLPEPSNGPATVRVFAENGREVLAAKPWAMRQRASAKAMFDPGRYRVVASFGAWTAERQFDLVAGTPATWELALH